MNGNDFLQLEIWTTDIETASALTGESRSKLAQAKSRELVGILISEALTLNKTWEDIKDCLCLKICNSDIHMSISYFMEIQQKEKEALAAYIHHFKREASRCKFDNDATTIRIFIKGLKNAHTLGTRVYEKGPQCLVDTIRKVENLQAAQQLTSTLLPSSSVNTMSINDNKCSQCQEIGHMACYSPCIKCFNITVPIEACIGLAGPNPVPAATDKGVTVAVTHEEGTLDPVTNPHATAHHTTEVQAHIITDETPHTADPHHAEVSPETTVDPDCIHLTNITTKHQQDHLPALIKQPRKPRTGNIRRSLLMIHHQNTIALMNKPVTQKVI